MKTTLIIIIAAAFILFVWHVLVLSFKCMYYERVLRKNKEMISDEVKQVMEMKSFF